MNYTKVNASSLQNHFLLSPAENIKKPNLSSRNIANNNDKTLHSKNLDLVQNLVNSSFLPDVPSFVSPTPPRREVSDEKLPPKKRRCRPRMPSSQQPPAKSNEPKPNFDFIPNQARDLQASYRILKHVGEGTFGSVFLTEERHTKDRFIIKRVKTMEDRSIAAYGFPYTALREIKILNLLDHEHVVNMKEVACTTGELLVLCFLSRLVDFGRPIS